VKFAYCMFISDFSIYFLLLSPFDPCLSLLVSNMVIGWTRVIVICSSLDHMWLDICLVRW